MGVAYRIEIEGYPVECATADDLMTLIRRLKSESAPAPIRPPRQQMPRATAARAGVQHKDEEIRALNGRHAKAIQSLLAHPQGVAGAQLSKDVGFEKITRLPGFMTMFRREIGKRGLPPEKVIVKERSYINGAWVSLFSINPKYVEDVKALVA